MNNVKRKLFFLLLFISLFASVSLPAQEEENLQRVLRSLEQISEDIAVYHRFLLAEFGGFGSSLFVSNQINGEEVPIGTFVFAVPLNAGFAVDTALALIEKFADSKNNIIVAFLGDEVNKIPLDMGGITHRGLRDLLTLPDMPENWVIAYFDAHSPPGEIVIHHGIRRHISPLELLAPLPPLFSSHGIPWSFHIRQNTVFKFGLIDGPEALSIIRTAGVYGFLLTGAAYNENTILPAELAGLLLEYSSLLNFPILNPDMHYSVLVFPGERFFFVSELMKVIIILSFVGLFLFLYLSYSARYSAVLMFHTRLFLRYFFIFIILISFFVISIKFAGSLYALLFSLFNMHREVPPFIAFIFTMSLSILIFSVSTYVLNIIRFPIRERFYRFAAVFFIIFGMFSSAIFGLSNFPVFLVVFVFFFLGTLFSNPVPVFIFALSLPLFLVFTLSNVFMTDSERLVALFINARFDSPDAWLVIFHTALLSLPAFLLVRRGLILSKIFLRRFIKLSKKNRDKIIPVMIVTVIFVMLVQILIPLRGIPSERRFIETSFWDESDVPLSLDINDIVFLDSRIITINLAARGSPVRFDVSIISMDERILLPIYSAPLPYSRAADGKRINLLLGERPVNPLSLEIVVPLDFQGRLELAAIYNVWDPAIDPFEEPTTGDYILKLSKSVNL